jgi:hypothetical protein
LHEDVADRCCDLGVGRGPQVRYYPDRGARITVGDLPSTLAVLSAVEKCLATAAV